MNCFYHDQNISVSQCLDCKKGLCKNCTNKFSIPICSSCNILRSTIEKRQIYFELFATISVGLILSYLLTRRVQSIPNHTFSMKEYLLSFYVYSGVYPGWKLLNKVFPKFYFSFSIIYFVILLFKFMLSFFVGIIALPISLYMNLKRLSKLK